MKAVRMDVHPWITTWALQRPVGETIQARLGPGLRPITVMSHRQPPRLEFESDPSLSYRLIPIEGETSGIDASVVFQPCPET